MRRSIIELHIMLSDGAAVLDWFDLFPKIVRVDDAGFDAGLGDEEDTRRGVQGLSPQEC